MGLIVREVACVLIPLLDLAARCDFESLDGTTFTLHFWHFSGPPVF